MHYKHLTPLWMAIFSDIIGFSLLITVYPSLAAIFSVSPFIIGLIASINGLFSFFSAPIWGKLSDRFGRKPMLLLSQLGTFIGFMILAFSNSLVWVIISRIVDGVFGGNFPIAKAVINDIVEPKDMAKQMTNVGIAHNFANLFGPALGGILFYHFGLMGPGLAAAFTSIFTMIITWVKLEETAPIKTHPELFLEKNPDLSEENGTVLEKPVKLQWHQNKPLVRAFLIFGFSAIGFSIIISNFSMFAFLKLGMNSQSMGIFLTISGIIQLIIRFTIYMPALRKWGEVNLAYAGFVMYLIEFIFLGFVVNSFQYLMLLILNSFATSGTRGGLSAFISNLADPKERGKIQGISSSLDTFAQIIGPSLGGALLTYLPLFMFGWFSWVFMAISLILLITATEMRRILQEKKDQKTPIPVYQNISEIQSDSNPQEFPI